MTDIERLARALNPEAYRDRGNVSPKSDLGRAVAAMQRRAEADVRAVLTELREPSCGMIEARAKGYPSEFTVNWQRAIDHLLSQ